MFSKYTRDKAYFNSTTQPGDSKLTTMKGPKLSFYFEIGLPRRERKTKCNHLNPWTTIKNNVC